MSALPSPGVFRRQFENTCREVLFESIFTELTVVKSLALCEVLEGDRKVSIPAPSRSRSQRGDGSQTDACNLG